jgi:glutamate synthase domain-containing protein 3
MGAGAGDCLCVEPGMIVRQDRLAEASGEWIDLDLETQSVRAVNQRLHDAASGRFRIQHPRGAHAIAAGLTNPLDIRIEGHVGYYCAGMNQRASVRIAGNASTGLAENMMSGFVHVGGDASQSAGASGCGGLLVIDGNAAARCGISLRGLDIIVKGSVGHMSAFMAQAGNLVVLGDTGDALGDSIYEARLFVRGSVKSLGADCIEKPMTDHHCTDLRRLLEAAGLAGSVAAESFKRYGSARRLYHFHIDNLGSY